MGKGKVFIFGFFFGLHSSSLNLKRVFLGIISRCFCVFAFYLEYPTYFLLCLLSSQVGEEQGNRMLCFLISLF